MENIDIPALKNLLKHQFNIPRMDQVTRKLTLSPPEKLEKEDLVIAKADKGNTVVVLNRHHHVEKIVLKM